MRILITGGAGFVGSSLAFAFKRESPSHAIVAFDNLKRRGAETNLQLFKHRGIDFVHGDVRNPTDLDDLIGEFDLLVEASAEPSVHAGISGSPHYVLETNLMGTLRCLEFARRRAENFIFLSTSRVYSIEPLKQMKLIETQNRFELSGEQTIPGVSTHGISETFPTHLPRSLYGASKLASELIIQEYVSTYGLRAIINRCGVLAGPGQFGKVDQGVFTLWVANHYFKRALRYTGFGGSGKQVRDLLHPLDLYSLIKKQLPVMDRHAGEVFNVGGGTACSTSLLELTTVCRQVTGNQVQVEPVPESTTVDIPLYISDFRKVSKSFNWLPECSVSAIVIDIANWIKANEDQVKFLFT